MSNNINWNNHLDKLFASKLHQNISNFLDMQYLTKQIFPPKNQIFKAFELSSFTNTKVVILGQDPYHQAKQANGLSFAVNPGIAIPSSLRNIYQEMSNDIGKQPKDGNLEYLAKQGVLLLNSILTVEKGQPNAHIKIGWQDWTDEIITILSMQKKNLVFILWGTNANKKAPLINRQKHLILTAPHPSPLSSYRGFFGCKHFSKTNTYLQQYQLSTINWAGIV